MILNYKVEKESQNVNNILRQNLDISSRLFSKLINNKLVKVNGQIFDTRNIVHKNDIISIDLNYPEDIVKRRSRICSVHRKAGMNFWSRATVQ